jgi:hypothetical protein
MFRLETSQFTEASKRNSGYISWLMIQIPQFLTLSVRLSFSVTNMNNASTAKTLKKVCITTCGSVLSVLQLSYDATRKLIQLATHERNVTALTQFNNELTTIQPKLRKDLVYTKSPVGTTAGFDGNRPLTAEKKFPAAEPEPIRNEVADCTTQRYNTELCAMTDRIKS